MELNFNWNCIRDQIIVGFYVLIVIHLFIMYYFLIYFAIEHA